MWRRGGGPFRGIYHCLCEHFWLCKARNAYKHLRIDLGLPKKYLNSGSAEPEFLPSSRVRFSGKPVPGGGGRLAGALFTSENRPVEACGTDPAKEGPRPSAPGADGTLRSTAPGAYSWRKAAGTDKTVRKDRNFRSFLGFSGASATQFPGFY